MKFIVTVLAALSLLASAVGFAAAAPLKINVAEFNVTNAPDSANLKRTLQEIFSSRLSPEQVMLVEKPDQAEILINGSYAQFGKMFSLDILIKNKANGSLTKVFEQGQGQEDIIPALGRLAHKVDLEIAKVPVQGSAKVTSSTIIPAATPIILKEQYVYHEPAPASPQDSWSSEPLDGVYGSFAAGRTLPSGERELFIASGQTIRAYLKSSTLKLIAEITIPAPGKILSIDTADLDHNGIPELYVTIIDREFPNSRVYQFDGNALVLKADKLPWFFRGIGAETASRIIYVQEIENGDKFYGDVKTLTMNNGSYTATGSIKLPRYGNLYNFIRIAGPAGKDNFIILDEDGYLGAYSASGEELWKSSEKYGGSENYFNGAVHGHSRSSRDLDRWTFLEQRMTQLKDGTLIVPRNEGSLKIGNLRSYDKHALHAFTWTGAVLKEKWHTRQQPGYLADYSFDQATNELLTLEVVQHPGIFNKGKSVISINRVD